MLGMNSPISSERARPSSKVLAIRATLRRDRALRDALTPGAPGPPTGAVARPWPPLAALNSGMGESQRPPLPHRAPHVLAGPTPERRGKRYARGVSIARSTAAGYCVPYAQELWAPLALQTCVLIM